MNEASSDAAETLLFNWDAPRPRGTAMAAFVGASAVLHGICFYLFQVVYPPAVSLLPPPARVTLITPDSEENRSLLRWVDAEDPALASETLRPADARLRALPRVPHVASYMSEEPKLKPVPPLALDTKAPSSQPPGPVPMSRAQAIAGTGPEPTRVQISEELSSLGPISLPVLHFTASSSESPQSLRFRIAVGPRGEIRYCFPMNSSGDPALDQQARRQLLLARFTPTASAQAPEPFLSWGVASFDWGNDIAHPQASVPRPAP
jgi:hypothetical protein